jgi:hypothetical protein
MSWLFCPSNLVPVLLSLLFSSFCHVLIALSISPVLLPCPGCPVVAVTAFLPQLSYLTVLSQLSCPSCPVLSLLGPSCHLLSLPSCHCRCPSCPPQPSGYRCPFLCVMFGPSCPGCPVLNALFRLSCADITWHGCLGKTQIKN